MTTRVLLDACVLVPATTRGLLIGAARAGYFIPLWSPQILAEWAHAAAKQGPQVAAQTATEQALLAAEFPASMVSPSGHNDLSLPDPDDIHVLAAAIAGDASELLTANTQDFPLRALAAYGLLRRHPDEFLLELAHAHPDTLIRLAQTTHASLPNAGGLRKTFQKSGLNRFAKWLASQG